MFEIYIFACCLDILTMMQEITNPGHIILHSFLKIEAITDGSFAFTVTP